MRQRTIGNQELALLQCLGQRHNATVGELATDFGAPHGLARSTVLTMMERLRNKGYLRRYHVAGVYRYAAVTRPDELLRGAVGRFVESTLRGSVSPFVAWMSQRRQVSDEELTELEELVAQLQSDRKGR